MSRLIWDSDAIDAITMELDTIDHVPKWVFDRLTDALNKVPSAYIPETKTIPTARSCVDLAEKVTATFYDEEHEEWTQQTVTIADVLDSVCDDYTILPSAESDAYNQGWADGQEALRKELWEDGRDRLD